jgi:glutaminyl-peptide cyclotransferase
MKVAGLIGLLFVGGGIAMYFAQATSPPAPRTSPFPPPAAFQDDADEPQGQGQFAAERATPVEIDGKRFMTYLEAVCAIGPRMSGTSGMKKQQELVAAHFDKLGLAVQKQTFKAKQESVKEPVEMTNMIVSIFPEKKKRVILCSHYDTRPIADQEPDPRKWREPFLSANDGGSGVAFLMELGHHLPKLKLEVGVDFVLFDGEEFIQDSKRDKYFLGSDYFAQTWKKTPNRPDYAGAILFDMIAGKQAKFPAEGNSNRQAPKLTAEIWRIANELKCRTFANRVGGDVLDDHLQLLEVGIPAIDIIDFSYSHWHRLSDRPENCDPEGPTQVAKVVSVWLQRLR